MQCGHKKATRLSKFITVWDDENIQDTFDKGYLAGIFDGEGCLSKNKKGVLKSIRFSQRPGVVLDNVKKCLTKFGFKYSESIYSESALSDKGYNALLLLGGKVEAIRFLGLIRPFRLLQKLSDNFNLGKLECTKCKLISKIDVGDQEVIAIQTSTKTYIAEGLASHNCTCASLAHCEMLWTSQSTVELVPTTQQVLDLYSAITGYNPQDPNSDQGANVLDVLNYWRNTGFLNHKIQAYVQINPRNTAHVKAAVDLFGAVYTGIQVPSRAQDQFSNGQPWDDINPDEIEGGHAIPLVAYDPNYITCVTWGAKQKISYPWLAKYMDECYAVLSTDWIAANGSAPSGFNLGQLYTDLRLVQ